jgi:hypothetical protein
MKNIKIIKIISSNSVIINVGARDGVETNWRFDICGDGENVHDPETGEDFGFFGLIKANIRPSRILEKMTECVNAETVFGGIADNLAFGLLRNTYLSKDLNVDPTQISGRYTEADMVIRVGDQVVRTKDYEPQQADDSDVDEEDDI